LRGPVSTLDKYWAKDSLSADLVGRSIDKNKML
jgi:hypothetical protein